MTKIAYTFLLAVLLPSGFLAFFAMSSLRDQRYVLERQQAELYQSYTDALAEKLRERMERQQRDFGKQVEELIADRNAREVAPDFDVEIRRIWPMAQVGFAVTLDGTLLAPAPYDGEPARRFRNENRAFLTNKQPVEIYSVAQQTLTSPPKPSHPSAPDAHTKTKPAGKLSSLFSFRGESASAPREIAEQPQVASGRPKLDADASREEAKPSAPNIPFPTAESLDEPADVNEKVLVEKKMAEQEAVPRGLYDGVESSPTVSAAVTSPGGEFREYLRASPSQAQTSPRPSPSLSPQPRAYERQTDRPNQAETPAALAEEMPVDEDTFAREELSQTEPAPNLSRTQEAQQAIPAAPRKGTGYQDQPDRDEVLTRQRAASVRNVIPQRQVRQSVMVPVSISEPEKTQFRDLVRQESGGSLARFLQDQLTLLVWHRSPRDPQIVFGAQLDLAQVKADLAREVSPVGDVGVALLDDAGRPVARIAASENEGGSKWKSPGGSFETNWKRPFVATEVGDILPHWEVAIYLLQPDQLARAAGRVQWTIGSLIALLVLAIALGSSLIISDMRRQLRLARQKTDFVSNVSHELKTPLTSIRMFSELLASGRVTDEAKKRSYLDIIAAESSRLTRLINNVLDFARMERREKKYDFASLNFTEVVAQTVESFRPQVENNGYTVELNTDSRALSVRADRDALAQIILNLLSNAEKYGGDAKWIGIHLEQTPTEAVLRVEDRGSGVPAGCEKQVFKKFYRAHDSLSSGIQGSGLGLTLSRQIAEAHGGSLVYRKRPTGGSCFTLTLPLADS